MSHPNTDYTIGLFGCCSVVPRNFLKIVLSPQDLHSFATAVVSSIAPFISNPWNANDPLNDKQAERKKRKARRTGRKKEEREKKNKEWKNKEGKNKERKKQDERKESKKERETKSGRATE